MTEGIVLSIIVPVYNGSPFIDRCVTTVLKEYRPGIELLLVEDGSEDDSFEKCSKWCSVHDWIRTLHHENHGVSYTRNRGIEEARGRYIWFVDVDDVILQDSIASILKIVRCEGPDILLFGYRSKLARKQLNEFDTNPSGQGRYLIEEVVSGLFWDLLGHNLIHNIGNKVYSTGLLRKRDLKFETGLTIYEDALFCVNAMKNARNLFVHPRAWYCYNLEENKQSLNHGYRKNYFIGVSLLYENIAKLLRKRDQEYYVRFLESVLDVVENEFGKAKYRYVDFKKFVQYILAENHVEEALEQINGEIELDVKWQLLQNNKYFRCYFLFWVAYKKKRISELKIVNDIFDLAYCVYKKVRLLLQADGR